MEMVRNAISWFEIPVDNLERARAFYSAIFDYDMPTGEIGQAKMGFLLYDESGGGFGGAVTKEEGTKPAGADGIRIYLNGGKNLNTVLNRVAGAGGSVVLPKSKITDELGYFAVFMDTEGNHLGLHSPE